MPDCPACPAAELGPTQLTEGLAALGCADCGGALLSLVAYREWIERAQPAEAPDEPHAQVAIEDSPDAILCPKCRAVMVKYRIAADLDNRLDHCPHCLEIWLDRGEWQIVEALARAGHLSAILTAPWQRRIVADQSEDMAEVRLREKLGTDYARFREVQRWLDDHPARDLILARLHRR